MLDSKGSGIIRAKAIIELFGSAYTNLARIDRANPIPAIRIQWSWQFRLSHQTNEDIIYGEISLGNTSTKTA